MTEPTRSPVDVVAMLRPAQERLEQLAQERAGYREQIAKLDDEAKQLTALLKIAGVIEIERRGPRKKQSTAPRAVRANQGELRTAILGYLAEHGDAPTPTIATALGKSPGTVGHALKSLRELEQVRLVRNEPQASGRGIRPVYGLWKGANSDGNK